MSVGCRGQCLFSQFWRELFVVYLVGKVLQAQLKFVATSPLISAKCSNRVVIRVLIAGQNSEGDVFVSGFFKFSRRTSANGIAVNHDFQQESGIIRRRATKPFAFIAFINLGKSLFL